MPSAAIQRKALQTLRIVLSLSFTLQALLPATVATTFAASVVSVSLTGGTGTTTVGGTLYAKQGGALTLKVTTDTDTQCVGAELRIEEVAALDVDRRVDRVLLEVDQRTDGTNANAERQLEPITCHCATVARTGWLAMSTTRRGQDWLAKPHAS